MPAKQPALTWMEPGDPFPAPGQAWSQTTAAPGLLAAGGRLDVDTLKSAYRQGIFPWFSAGQPILWWSPNPRMVLEAARFQLHPSLRKTLRKFIKTPGCELRFDTRFSQVMAACATSPRPGQDGTWIVPAMQDAYGQLHQSGLAHSVETWVDGELVGGLYCVAIGNAVFGESMFSRRSDASKIALAALIAFCLQHGITQVDCQQNTAHLASLGAREWPRQKFLDRVAVAAAQTGPNWQFDALYWRNILPTLPVAS
ncbi:MAG: leucyl/phenylalanyl-tRNA--protein transferase [Betaproteobacteria bacterium]